MNAERPFDAQAVYLSDQHKDQAEWRTVSLVHAVRGILEGGQGFNSGTRQARIDALDGAADELTRRGLDATALVRYGMWQQVLGALITNLIATRLAPHWDVRPSIELEAFNHEAWVDLLGLPSEIPAIPPGDIDQAARRLLDLVAPITPLVVSWVSVASLKGIIHLVPPAQIRDPSSEEISQIVELQGFYRWIVDHFSKTFFYEWETTSLYLAHRWKKGLEVPPCEQGLMLDRPIDVGDLSIEIANRVTSDDQRSDTSAVLLSQISMSSPPAISPSRQEAASILMRSLAPEMTQHALRLLEEERYREAAAVFEFAVQGNPNDAGFRNNWGFCLVPVDPREALDHLVEAQSKGYHNPAVNVYNQMCCLVAMNRQRAALSVAVANWETVRTSTPIKSFVWEFDEEHHKWTLSSCDNPIRKVADFAATIAGNNKWMEDVRTWISRSRDIGLVDSCWSVSPETLGARTQRAVRADERWLLRVAAKRRAAGRPEEAACPPRWPVEPLAAAERAPLKP